MALFINGTGQDTFSMNGVSIDNLYVDGVLVWSVYVPELTIPRYELTDTLIDASTIDDSANTLPDYNGLLTESDGTTPYEPTVTDYPQDGTLLLESARIMDTQYTKLETDAVYAIYDVVKGTSYKIAALEPVSTGIINVWEGDQDTPLSKTQSDKLYTIPVDSWKITDGEPDWVTGETLSSPVYIKFINGTQSIAYPPGVTVINDIADRTDNLTVHTLQDIDGNPSSATLKLNTQWDDGYAGVDSGDNSNCMSDAELEDNFRKSFTGGSIELYIPEGTFEIRLGAMQTGNSATAYRADWTLDGVTLQTNASNDGGTDACAEWTITSIGATYLLEGIYSSGGNYTYIGALRITEVSA